MPNFRTGLKICIRFKGAFPPQTTNSEEQQAKVCSWGERTNLAWLGKALPPLRLYEVFGGPGAEGSLSLLMSPAGAFLLHFQLGSQEKHEMSLLSGPSSWAWACRATSAVPQIGHGQASHLAKAGNILMQMETSASHQGGGDWEKPREAGRERLAVVCTQCLEQPQRGHKLGTAGRREGLAFLCTSTLRWAAATSSQHAWVWEGQEATGSQESSIQAVPIQLLPLSGNINSKANIEGGQNWNFSQRHSYWSASHGKNRNSMEQRLWDLQPWHCMTKVCNVTGVETEWIWGRHAALHMLNRSQGSCRACPAHCAVAPFSW